MLTDEGRGLFMQVVEGSHDTRIFDCKAGLRVRNPIRDDLLVITADPPLPHRSRRRDRSHRNPRDALSRRRLFPPGVWPIDVYVISVRGRRILTAPRPSTHRVRPRDVGRALPDIRTGSPEH